MKASILETHTNNSTESTTILARRWVFEEILGYFNDIGRPSVKSEDLVCKLNCTPSFNVMDVSTTWSCTFCDFLVVEFHVELLLEIIEFDLGVWDVSKGGWF